MLRLMTTGRHSGQERRAILAYFEDGGDLVLMSMNGWSEGATGWSLNLRAQPEAAVELADGTRRPVKARFADGEERERLWARWGTFDKDLEGFAARRSDTPVIVLEPRAAG
jgi:deazaflavin-dependent oxidoreductase (nitroreductase family)